VPLQADHGTGPAPGRGKPLGWLTRSSFVSDLRAVLAERNFRRLFATRLVSQTGDGVVTAAIGTYVFFSAATFTSPAAGAAAFTVLYVPYSLIGPFAGVFIDRWSRRQILVLSALLRSVFVLLTAVLMASGNRSVPLFVAYLLVLGVNRFFLASLSAALPHVVAGDKLVMANSVSPTAGGIVGAVGGLLAAGLNAATGDTERGAAITMLVAGVCYVAASMVAATMKRDLLGPDLLPGAVRGRLSGDLASVVSDLAAGARYVARHRGPAAALGAVGGANLMFGILSLISILLYRNYFYPSSASLAEGHYIGLATVSAIGYGCAALLMPPATRRLSKSACIALLLTASALVTIGLGETFDQLAYLAFGFFLWLFRQGVAICATTILQEEVDDTFRGRMFAFYDVMFNVMLAVGVLLTAAFMPLTGRSPVIVGLVAAGYAIVAIGYWLARGQSWSGAPSGGPPEGPPSPGSPVSPSPAAQRSNS
jgi:MFS family permease